MKSLRSCCNFNDMKLLVATRNMHKLEEIRDIFNFEGLELLNLNDYPNLPEVIEDGNTFVANAIKKAVETAEASGMWTISDDSGLEVDALGGAPGVYSARYAGEQGDYRANNEKLMKEIAGKTDRSARFRCVIALSDPQGNARTVEGKCEGVIIDDERGDHGFGYDPLFVPDGYEETFAEMSQDLKNSISHRAAALKSAVEEWEGLFMELGNI